MRRSALLGVTALMVACAQQQQSVRSPETAGAPAAGSVETPSPRASPGGVIAPGQETHKPAQHGAAAVAAEHETAQSAPAPAPALTKVGSGISLLELPATQNAIVNVQLRFRSGAVDDPPGKAGLTGLTAQVMAEGGTQTLSSKQLLEALFPMAAELDVRVDKEMTTFIARVHKDNLGKFLPILTDVVLHPRWDPAEFRRLRDAAVNDVEKRLRQGDDENLGKLSLEEVLFRDHPYGRITLGHATDLKSMTVEDLKAQAARVFTADRLTVGVSGGYPEGLGETIAHAFSALPRSAQPPAAIPLQKP